MRGLTAAGETSGAGETGEQILRARHVVEVRTGIALIELAGAAGPAFTCHQKPHAFMKDGSIIGRVNVRQSKGRSVEHIREYFVGQAGYGAIRAH